MAIPSPVLMAPLVVNGKLWPPPPVAKMTTGAKPPASHLHCDHATALAVLVQQFKGEELVITLDRRELERSLKKRVQDVKAALVRGVPCSLLLHAAEGPYRDRAVILPGPGTAPVFELHQFTGCLADEILHHLLVTQPVAPADGVVEMHFKRIVSALDARCTAFCRTGVAAHRVNLRNQRHFEVRIRLGDFDRSA